MSTAPPAQRFRDNCVALAIYCSTLVEHANKEGLTTLDPVFVRAGVLFLEHGCPPDEMIEAFINYSHPYWSQIHAKDEHFFHENVTKVFPMCPTDHPGAEGSYLENLPVAREDLASLYLRNPPTLPQGRWRGVAGRVPVHAGR